MIKEKYSDYYTARGSYRKYLMKQESANTAEMYDYFSRLEIRCRQLLKCNELSQAANPNVSSMIVRVGEFISDMRDLAKRIFEKEGDNLHRMFADLYDESASVVEGFEFEASKYLSKIEILSEDAKLLQRRTHFDKNHAKDASRSNAAKMAWRTGKDKFLQGIKKFHASSAGKQFHRNLSRFSKRGVTTESFTHDDLVMTAKGLSSLCTHLIVEVEGYFTNNAGKLDESIVENATNMREVFYIFNEALCSLVAAIFEEDNEAVANVIDIIKDFYDIDGGAGDKDWPDTSGVDLEVTP